MTAIFPDYCFFHNFLRTIIQIKVLDFRVCKANKYQVLRDAWQPLSKNKIKEKNVLRKILLPTEE